MLKHPSEDQEQRTVVDWLKAHRIRHYATPNMAQRSYKLAQWYKLLGMSAGVPDLCIPVPKGPYHGMYIEMKSKAKSAKTSQAQEEWINYLSAVGYFVPVCRGADEAIAQLNHYLFNDNF